MQNLGQILGGPIRFADQREDARSIEVVRRRGRIEIDCVREVFDRSFGNTELVPNEAAVVEEIGIVRFELDRDIELAQSISKSPLLEEAIRSIVVPFRFAHGVLTGSSHRDMVCSS